MPFVPKTPDSCRDLDLAHVSSTLAKQYGDICSAARELGVSPQDLKRLTWAKPHLLDVAHEEMELVVALAWGELIRALWSDEPRRRMWASDRILSSWMARNHPFAPARRHVEVNVRVQPQARLEVKWADAHIPKPIERDAAEHAAEEKPGAE
jgi:hypothetical protein